MAHSLVGQRTHMLHAHSKRFIHLTIISKTGEFPAKETFHSEHFCQIYSSSQHATILSKSPRQRLFSVEIKGLHFTFA